MKKSLRYLIIILSLFFIDFSAYAGVRIIHRHRFKESQFSPSAKDFSVTAAAFKGSLKEEILPSTSEFKPSSAELMDSKYKPVIHNFNISSKPRKSSLSGGVSGLSENLDLSDDFSPSAEFKAPKKRRLR